MKKGTYDLDEVKVMKVYAPCPDSWYSVSTVVVI